MRLSADQQEAILSTLRRQNSTGWEVYLFGSRTDDNQRGGDIDLAVVVAENDLAMARAAKLRILVDIKTIIGEQRIDLEFIDRALVHDDVFWRDVLASAILLARL